MHKARELFTVRFWGVLAAVKHGGRTIVQDGSITLKSGMLSRRPRNGAPMPTAVAGAIEYLTRGLAMDLTPGADPRVRVSAVCPGIVLTDHVKQMPGAMLQSIVAPLAVLRAASPAEAAKAYVSDAQRLREDDRSCPSMAAA